MLEIADPAPVLEADERAVRQIVFNLLSNAIKHTPPGGSIIVRCPAIVGDAIEITVANTGIGIPADQIGRLALPFEKVDGLYTAAQRGAGLGLALVKWLMDLHGDEIWIDSTVGSGTTVTLRFPQPPAAAPGAPVEPAASRG